MFLKTLIFSLLIPFFSSSCFFQTSDIITNDCLLCDMSSYNPFSLFLEKFDPLSCFPKLNESTVISTYYITPQKNCSILQNCDGSINNPFDSLITAMTNESLRRITEIPSFDSQIIFKFFRGTHYILPEEITAIHIDFFRRMKIALLFSPLYCEEIKNEGICSNFTKNEKITIIIKTDYFSFFITKTLQMENIIIDGEDLALISHGDPCANELQICCGANSSNTNCSYHITSQKFYSSSYLSKSRGFFNLESIIEDISSFSTNITKISLFLTNVDFININIGYDYSSANYIHASFILINENLNNTNITVINSTYTNCFFPLGLIFYNNFYRFGHILSNFTISTDLTNIITTIFISNSLINYYNKVNLQISYDISSLFQSIFIFNDFSGNFTFFNNTIMNSFIFTTVGGNFISVINVNTLNISLKIQENYIDNNFFLTLLLISKTSQNERISLVSFFLNNFNNNNNISSYFLINYIQSFRISGVFNNITMPFQYFININFTNITLENCHFSNNHWNTFSFYLISQSSYYSQDLTTVFTKSANNAIFYSNESIFIISSIFENNDFLLINNFYFLYEIKIFLCFFKNLDFSSSLKYPFVKCAPERNFAVLHSFFSNISCGTNMFYVNPVLNVFLSNSTFENFVLFDGDIFYLYTSTLVNLPNTLNFTFLYFSNISFIINNLAVSLPTYGVIAVTTSGTGSGAYLNAINIVIIDVFYNLDNPTIYQTALFSQAANFYIKDVIVINNLYSMSFFIELKVVSGSLYIDGIFIFNKIPSYSAISTGILQFTSTIIINSKIILYNNLFSYTINIFLTTSINIFNLILEGYSPNVGSFLVYEVGDISYTSISHVKMVNYNNSQFGFITISSLTQLSNKVYNSDNSTFFAFTQNTFHFGVLNSIFQNTYGQTGIQLLFNSDIVIQNCVFEDISANNGGFLNLMQNCRAAIYKLIIINSFASVSGGSIYIDTSTILVYNIFILSSISLQQGGVANIRNSLFFMKNSVIKSTFAGSNGGVFYLENAILSLISCFLYNSTASYFGGHISAVGGILNITDTFLDAGVSMDYAASLYIEGSVSYINNTVFNSCIGEIGLIVLSGSVGLQAGFENVIFSKNRIGNSLIFLFDLDLILKKVAFYENILYNGYIIEINGLSFIVEISIDQLEMKDNIAYVGIISIINGMNYINNSLFLENTSKKNFFMFLRSILHIYNISIKISPTSTNSTNTILTASNSNIFLENAIFSLFYQYSAISSTSCNIICISTAFIRGNSIYGGGIQLTTSNFTGNTLLFYKNYALEGGTIYSSFSIIQISNSVFLGNFAKTASNLDLYGSSLYKILVKNCTFFDFLNTAIYISSLNLSLIDSSFNGGISNKNGKQAIFLENSYDTDISNSNFSNFYKYSAINSKNSDLNPLIASLYISICRFNSSFSDQSGGFIAIQGKITVNLQNNLFTNGYADIGGAIYYYPSNNMNCTLYLKNNIFINNTAFLSGGALQVFTNNIIDDSNTFFNNTALTGNNINYYPSKLLVFITFNNTKAQNLTNILYQCNQSFTSSLIQNFQNEDIFMLNSNFSIIPGYSYSLIVVILDSHNTKQKSENNTVLNIFVSDLYNSHINISNFIPQNNIISINEGIGLFQNFKISGDRYTSLIITFTYDSKTFFNSFQVNYLIYFPNCNRGDSYINNICKICSENTFSFDFYPNEDSCKKCPENAICSGSDVIIPLASFWRKDENSSSIIACLVPAACPSQTQLNSTFTYICSEGYNGNLCSSCAEGYGKINLSCGKCSTNILLFVFLFIFGYMITIVYTYYLENQRITDDADLILNKLFQNHLSYFILINSLKLNWKSVSQNFMSVITNYVSTSPSSVYSFDCIFGLNQLDYIQSNFIIVGFSPFYLLIIMIIFNFFIRICKIFFKKNNDLKTKISDIKTAFFNHFHFSWILVISLKSFITLYLNLYSQMLSQFIKIYGCISIDGGDDTYAASYPDINCGSDLYSSLFGICSFFLVFWGLFIPIVIFYYLKKMYGLKGIEQQSQVISSPNLNMSINFDSLEGQVSSNKKFIIFYLTKGYKPEHYYWEIVIFFRKAIVILMTIVSNQVDNITVVGLTIIIFTVFIMINYKIMPHKNLTLTNFENLSMYIIICSLGCGLLSSMKELSENLQNFFFFCLIGVNCIFFFYWFKLFSRKIKIEIKKTLSLNRKSLKSRKKPKEINLKI